MPIAVVKRFSLLRPITEDQRSGLLLATGESSPDRNSMSSLLLTACYTGLNDEMSHLSLAFVTVTRTLLEVNAGSGRSALTVL